MKHKECFKCGNVFPLSEFYRHSRMADGHLGKCKECTKRDTSENYRNKREYYSEYDKRRYQTPQRRQYMQDNVRERRRRNPDKYKAHMAVSNAKRDGKLTPKPCKFCNNPNVQAHHEDYSKPLDVIWVCFKCHREKFHNQVVVSDYGTERNTV